MRSTRRQFFQAVAVFGGAVLLTRGLAACAFDAKRSAEDVGENEEALVTCQPPTRCPL